MAEIPIAWTLRFIPPAVQAEILSTDIATVTYLTSRVGTGGTSHDGIFEGAQYPIYAPSNVVDAAGSGWRRIIRREGNQQSRPWGVVMSSDAPPKIPAELIINNVVMRDPEGPVAPYGVAHQWTFVGAPRLVIPPESLALSNAFVPAVPVSARLKYTDDTYQEWMRDPTASDPTDNWWSGEGDLEFEARTWRGAQSRDAGMLMDISAVDQSTDLSGQSATVRLAIGGEAIRRVLSVDLGRVEIEVGWLYRPAGGAWTRIPRYFRGVIDSSVIIDGVFTARVTTHLGDLDRTRPEYWSAETAAPGDKYAELAQEIEQGLRLVDWELY